MKPEEKTTMLMDGTRVSVRPLKSSDVEALADYFLGVSERTKSYFAPHPFDRETAEKICKEFDDATLRLLAVCGDKLVGYFILTLGIRPNDKKRYAGLDEDDVVSVAPSIADEFQNRGLGTEMMSYAIDVARRRHKRKMILSGGVQASNNRAIHFYRKCGFRTLREFQTTVRNYDMLLDLGKRQRR